MEATVVNPQSAPCLKTISLGRYQGLICCRKILPNLCLYGISIFLVILSCSIGRPFWIDEFLHFALGAFRCNSDALHVIHTTTTGVNHGQTGVYLIIGYFRYLALAHFGCVSPVSLRVPCCSSALFIYLGIGVCRGFGN